MKYSLVISDEARLDILYSYIYYQEQKEGLGDVFEKSIDKGIKTILDNPFLFQIRYLNIRIHFTNKFPFGIHYAIYGNVIRIFAVYHTSRDPISWIERNEGMD